MAAEKMKQWVAGRFSWLRHHRTDADFGEELKTHLEMQEEDYVGLGMPVAEARRRARLGLGSTGTVIENVRDVEFITMLEGCYRDFVLGLRALRRSPVFSFTAILTLGIGIGANTVVFTLLYGLLLRSLPVKDPATFPLKIQNRASTRAGVSGEVFSRRVIFEGTFCGREGEFRRSCSAE
jgi:hypothetical protein